MVTCDKYDADSTKSYPFSSRIARHGSISLTLSADRSYHLRLSKFHDAFEGSPAQQSQSADDEAPDDDLVLVAVPLEAHGSYILLLGVLAEVNALVEAE